MARTAKKAGGGKGPKGNGAKRGVVKQARVVISQAADVQSRRRDAEAGQRHRDAMATVSRQRMSAAADIAPIPDVADRARREACAKSLREFCDTYMPKIFYLKWSKGHLELIKALEKVITRGGMAERAMPRGGGKSSLARAAALWGILYGYRKSLGLITATESRAEKMLKDFRTLILKNRLLLEDFPEVLYPLVCLQNDARRQAKQHAGGELTLSIWGNEYIVFPTVTGENMPARLREAGMEVSPAAGSTIFTKSLDSQDIRGESIMTAEGAELRPDCLLIDDPQTRQSARSPSQTKKRIDTIEGDVMYMAGPDKRLAAVMTITKMYDGDMADHYQDRTKAPQWQGHTTKMVLAFPTNEKLWDEYRRLLVEGLVGGDDDFWAASDFYRGHRAAMDAGAEVSWAERYPDNCVSAIQHAMNLRILNEEAFMAEMQNEPMADDSHVSALGAEEITQRLNNRRHLTVPTMCSHLVAFIDVHAKLLYWATLAVEDNFTGYLIDCGAYPQQKSEYFTLRQASHSLRMSHKGTGEEGAIYAGLLALMEKLAGQAYVRDDGEQMRLNLALVDTGYKKDVVERACRQGKFPGVFMASKGIGVKASGTGLTERKKAKGEQYGENWRVTAAQGSQSMRLVLYDTNYWKTFTHGRLATAVGDRGACTLWGDRPGRHKMLADHLTAEYAVHVEARGRVVYEWQAKPGNPDNHLLDCMVGCMVAGSMRRCELLERVVPRKKRRPKGQIKAKRG